MNHRFFVLCIVMFSLMVPFRASAQSIDDLNSEANALWEKRDNFHSALKAMILYEKIASSDLQDIESRIKIARSALWLFEQFPAKNKITTKKEVIAIIARGIKACEQVIQIEPKNAGAWHWLIFLSSAKNYHESLFDWNFFLAIKGSIYIAHSDLTYNYGGLYRYWGHIMLNVPKIIARLLDFSTDKIIWLFNESLKIEPNYLPTKKLLGECYLKNKDKIKAKQILEEILKADPDALKNYSHENRLAQKRARELLNEL